MTDLDARSPLAVNRRRQLLHALQRQGTVRVSELTDVLGVTPVTVRRDIAQLASDGLVRRVHGGAVLVQPPTATAAETPDAGQTTTAQPCVGMLVPSLDYYWPEVARGAQEAASQLGLRVVLRASSYESEDDRPQLERLLDQDGFQGLVIAPRMDAPSTGRTIEWLSSTGTPLVLVERTATVGNHDAVVESVVSDHALGAGTAVRHLTALGHRRVGLLVNEHSPTSPYLRTGWSEALREAGDDHAPGPELWVPDNRSPDLDALLDSAVEQILRTGTTAVLAHADEAAMALVQRWEKRGLGVPGDLSVVAYDDEVASLFSPPLTAVRPPRRSIGRAAVELLAARVADPARPTHRVVISPTLSVRESTAQAPEASRRA